MKKLYFLLFSIIAFTAFAQSPKLINYQGVARKPSGVPMTSAVKIKFEIFDALIGGTSVFSEIQTTSTNSLGLFSTQIGKTSVLSLSWDSGPWFLEVSIDTTNTSSSFIIVGRQQLVSVPYALYAENAGSAPDPAITFSNNILNVGSNSVTIPSGPTYVAGSDIAITSGSIINTAPDKTVTLAPAGNAIINGSYPNFTVGAIPQTLGITSNVITLSNGGGSIVLPSTSNTPNTLITGTGAATVTTSGTNTFNVAVAPVNISGSGATTVGGSYPNFVINSPTFTPPPPTTINGQGIANVSPTSGNNFTVSVPPPTLSYAGNVLTINQGPGSSAVSIPAGITPTITGQGIATVTPVSGNNFTVNVAPPNLVGTGITTVTGSYPSYTINTPAPPSPLPAWSLFGNAGTNLSNFIGTTDNVPFNIRVNNQKAGQIDPLLSNTFFGYWSGRDNTNGTQNTATGINSLLKNTVGIKNAAIGSQAMENNLNGGNNSALGSTALFSNSTGSFNVGVGSDAGYSNISGSGNVFLGNKAGFSETGSNKLYIANNATNIPLIYGDFSANKIGLGTNTPAAKLDIVSGAAPALKITDGSQGFGKVFTSDAAGVGSWQFPAASPGIGTPNFLPKWNAGGNGLQNSQVVDDGLNVNIAGDNSDNAYKLVTGKNASSVENVLGLTNTNNIDGAGTAIGFRSKFISTMWDQARIYGVTTNGIAQGSLVFQTMKNRSLNNMIEVMRLTGDGFVGIGTIAPTTLLHVNSATPGAVTIVDNTQGDGKILTSDASGVATWKKGSNYKIIYPNANGVSNLGTVPVMVPTMSYAFTKLEAKTTIEASFNGHATASGMTGSGISIEIRIDGANGDSFSGRTIYWSQDVPNPRNIVMNAIFEFLPAGPHTVEIWVSSSVGTTSSVFINPGNWADQIIVKETH